MTPEIHIETPLVLADGQVVAVRLSRDEVAGAIDERLVRYRERFPAFARALESVMAPFERADPEAAMALRYSMVSRDAAEIAMWMGIDERTAAELAERGATAIAGPLGEELEQEGLIVTTFVDKIEPVAGTDADAEDDRAAASGTVEVAGPLSLLKSWQASGKSPGWPAVIADVASRTYRRARQSATEVVAKLREENWETFAGARERFALHDMRDDTFLCRAVAAATAGHAAPLARSLQVAGRVARVATTTNWRDRDRSSVLDRHESRLRNEYATNVLRAAIVRGLGARRAAWLARWESRRRAKAFKAIEAMAASPAEGAPAPRVDAIRLTIPPDIGSAVDEVAGRKGMGTGDYKPLAIFSREGPVLLAGVAPSYEVLIEAAYRKTGNLKLLAGADMRGIRLEKLDLATCAKGASWRGVLLDQARLTECNLAGVDFGEASIDRAKLTNCSLAGASFANASLRWSLLRGCDFAETACTWKDERGLGIEGGRNWVTSTGASAPMATGFYFEGLDMQQRGHFREAAASYQVAIERSPKQRYEYAVALGDVLYGLGSEAAGDAYRKALAVLADGRSSARAFEAYFALAASAERKGDLDVARAALEASLGADVRRSDKQTYRAERQFGLLAREPSTAVEFLRRAFSYAPPLGMNDRKVAWRLAEASADAYVATMSKSRDATLLDTFGRAVERLRILERGTPDGVAASRLETLRTRLTELRRHERSEARAVIPQPTLRAVKDAAIAPSAAGPSAAPERMARPGPGVDAPSAGMPSATAPSPGSAASGTHEFVRLTKANVDQFFERQLANARDTAGEPLATRVEAFQSYFRDEMQRIERVSPGPELWARETPLGREPLDGWEFVAGVCKIAGPTLMAHVDGLAPKPGEEMGAIRPDATGRLLGPRGEVVVDAKGAGLHSHFVSALKSPPATQVFHQALGESYSSASHRAIVEALETRGATFVAENAQSVQLALAEGGGVQAQIELIDLVSRSDKQVMHELCERAKEGANINGRPARSDVGPSL